MLSQIGFSATPADSLALVKHLDYSGDGNLSIDELERRERSLLAENMSWMDANKELNTNAVVECARYRWTQDATYVKVEVPLPRRPSETDVALVVGETSFDLSVVNADLVIRGQLSGEANPGRCGWDLWEEGDGLTVRVAKRGDGDWDAFLVDEVPTPTVSYKGVCEVTGASYEQTSTEMRIEIILPDHVEARDVNVNVSGGAWAVNAGAWSLGGALPGALGRRCGSRTAAVSFCARACERLPVLVVVPLGRPCSVLFCSLGVWTAMG